MNEQLTNEAAELIGQYAKGGKKAILSMLLEMGGIIKKEVKKNDGRKTGYERIQYFYTENNFVTYDPSRVKKDNS